MRARIASRTSPMMECRGDVLTRRKTEESLLYASEPKFTPRTTTVVPPAVCSPWKGMLT